MAEPRTGAIPTYGLYGEAGEGEPRDWLHWETILSRSRLHDFRIAPHRHAQIFQILQLTRGGAELTLDGRTRRLAPPAVVVVPPPTVHGYAFSADVEGCVLSLLDRDVAEVLAGAEGLAESFRRPLVLGADSAPERLAAVGQAIGDLITAADGREAGQGLVLRARLALLLVAIHRAALAEAADPEMLPGGRHARRFEDLVEGEFRNRRPIGFYAAALGITPTHLNRVCRRAFGLSALAVIERRALVEARRYLVFSGLSVKEIAILLGFQDPAYFNRRFRRAAGISPGEYRRRARGEPDRPRVQGGTYERGLDQPAR